MTEARPLCFQTQLLRLLVMLGWERRRMDKNEDNDDDDDDDKSSHL